MDSVQLTAAATTIALYICREITDSNQRLLISSLLTQVAETITRIDVQYELIHGKVDRATLEKAAIDSWPII